MHGCVDVYVGRRHLPLSRLYTIRLRHGFVIAGGKFRFQENDNMNEIITECVEIFFKISWL